MRSFLSFSVLIAWNLSEHAENSCVMAQSAAVHVSKVILLLPTDWFILKFSKVLFEQPYIQFVHPKNRQNC